MKSTRRLMPPAARPPARSAAGFTIVETLIVLVIAGIILLVIFEAIPSLVRSGRNNQRKQDVQTILAAVSHYELNDSGNFPQDCGGGGHSACTSAAAGSPNDYFLRYATHELTFYTDPPQVVTRVQSAGASPGNNPNTDLDTVYIYNYQKCNLTGGSSTWHAAGYTDVVALYAIEQGHAAAPLSRCQQL